MRNRGASCDEQVPRFWRSCSVLQARAATPAPKTTVAPVRSVPKAGWVQAAEPAAAVEPVAKAAAVAPVPGLPAEPAEPALQRVVAAQAPQALGEGKSCA